jgi:hypothetical protein
MARLDKLRSGVAEKKCFGHALGYSNPRSDNFFIKIDSDHPHADVGDGYELSLNPREAQKLFRKLVDYVAALQHS